MSTTQQFFSSGAGNGLPFCPAPYAVVQDLYSWMSSVKFPGANAGERLKNASHFFWNLKAYTDFELDFTVHYDATTNESSSFFVQADPSGNVALHTAGENGLLSDYEPFERVCPHPETPGAYNTWTGEGLYAVQLETYLDSLDVGSLGRGLVLFSAGYDSDGDLSLLYFLNAYTDQDESFLALSSDPLEIEYNSDVLTMKVGPGEGDNVDLIIYGLFLENTSYWFSFDGGLVTPEFWAFTP